MKVKGFILLFFLLIVGVSFSQRESVYIYGKIYDRETKQALNHISVHINNSSISTETDKNGIFEFYIPKIKHISLIISSIGYKKEIKELEINADEDYFKISI